MEEISKVGWMTGFVKHSTWAIFLLKWILRDVKVWTGFSRLRIGFCEHSTEPSGSLRGITFVDSKVDIIFPWRPLVQQIHCP
jgi:hypothetical protein